MIDRALPRRFPFAHLPHPQCSGGFGSRRGRVRDEHDDTRKSIDRGHRIRSFVHPAGRNDGVCALGARGGGAGPLRRCVAAPWRRRPCRLGSRCDRERPHRPSHRTHARRCGDSHVAHRRVGCDRRRRADSGRRGGAHGAPRRAAVAARAWARNVAVRRPRDRFGPARDRAAVRDTIARGRARRHAPRSARSCDGHRAHRTHSREITRHTTERPRPRSDRFASVGPTRGPSTSTRSQPGRRCVDLVRRRRRRNR